jgi:thiamine-phosphate pyrophosphorylase
MFDILCVTNRSLCDDFISQIEKVAKKKPNGIILREKDLKEDEYEALARQVIKVCDKYNVPCILHSFIDVAIKIGIDKIHLPMHILRNVTDSQKEHFSVIGASCHSIQEAIEAEKLGCTYITTGHIFATDCKKGVAPRGLEFLKDVCNSVSIPVYAIGGINENNIESVKEVGANGVCIMSGFMRDNKMNFSRNNLLLYAVTDRKDTDQQTFYNQIEQSLEGGITMLQLREKNLDEETFVEEAIKVRDLCHKYNVPLIINDNINVALMSNADGVHVGQDDLPANEIRKITSDDFIIGVTAKTIEQAKKAEKDGANYIGVGAVFPSPTKTNAIRITNEQLNEICLSVSIPAVAIGGINETNISTLNGCKMSGVAVVSAIFSADNIKSATQRLKNTVSKMIK